MNYFDYIALRAERNRLRDIFEGSGSFLHAAELQKQIKEMDKQLTDYEKDL